MNHKSTTANNRDSSRFFSSSASVDERAPLLQYPEGLANSTCSDLGDHHTQFCHLVGVRPVNLPHGERYKPHPESLYSRAVKRRTGQNRTYMFTATLINSMLLAQVVLGAALTGLAASDSSRVLITVFGALNTVIAGVVAFLKSRGQPMRARMFRDDLERVVDEIENSAVMWYGISQNVHGYEAIDTDAQVTVRGEVARLTRLYDKAVKTNTINDPDMYSAGAIADSYSAGLRKSGAGAGPNLVAAAIPDSMPAPVPVPAPDADDSPASKAPETAKPKEESKAPSPAEEAKPDATAGSSTPSTAAATPAPESAPKPPPSATVAAATSSDPDESPASAANPPLKKDNSTKSDKTFV